jgi:RNA polymerase sigma-70 factor (ECF subfamily)
MEQFPQAECERVPDDPFRQQRAQEAVLAGLVARATAGDQQTLAALYDATSALVYGLALRILREPQAAEDVTFDVYAQVVRQETRYEATRGTPTTWLMTLTRRHALDRLRQEPPRLTHEEGHTATTHPPALTAEIDEGSATPELRRLVQRALALLPPEQRHVIELAYYAGWSPQHIAVQLGESLGTVTTHIHTGMMRLRESLHSLLPEGHL